MSALRPEAPAAFGAGVAEAVGVGAGAAFAALPPLAGEAAAAAADGGVFGAGAALAPSDSTIATTVPSEISSPSLTLISLTTPATDDGTSIVALSDSSVTRPWSLATVSPAFTSTSITGTFV